MKRTRGEKIFNICKIVFLILFAFTTLYPFIYTLSISFSTAAEASRGGFHLYPHAVSTTAYKMVFRNHGLIVAYGNTIFRTVVGTLLGLLVTCFYGYALSRPETPHKKFFTVILIFTMLFNGGKIPTYLALKQYHLINNIWVYVLPTLISAYNVIVSRSFFMSIPNSLNESAKIDGAGEFYIFFKIIVPLSKPIIMTLALFMAVMHWNAWYDSLMYISDNNKIVVQLLLQRIINESDVALITQGLINPEATEFTSTTVKSATVIVTILPILAFYPFIQKYFTKGMMLGAVKG
jgi:putative aldouronate transport system permease protein